MGLYDLSAGGGGSTNVNVSTSSSTTAYNEQLIANNYAFIQSVPVYNLLPANFRAFTTESGTAGVTSKQFTCTTGTSVGGYGAIQSFRALNYKAGVSGTARFSAIFPTGGVATSWQGVGLLNLGDELSFGYNGTDFGIWHRYNGLAEVRTITVTGAAGGSENLTLTLNSVAYTIPLTSGTTAHNAYEISDWLNNSSNQTVWKADQVDSTVIISAQSDGAKAETYTFSSGTATGTIAQNTAGTTKTSDFITQSNWNQNTFEALDPTKGNMYSIVYKYSGFGNIQFFIENQDTGTPTLVHVIKYSNANTVPSMGNPSLRTGLYCVSLGSTTDITVQCAGIAAFMQNIPILTRNPRAYVSTQTVDTNFTNIFTIRNRRTYNSIINQVEIEPQFLTLASESSKNTEFELRATTDTAVEQNFTAVGNNLISDVDTSVVTVTVGRLLLAGTLAPGETLKLNLTELRIRAPPTIHLVLQARVTGGADSDVTGSLVWIEDL